MVTPNRVLLRAVTIWLALSLLPSVAAGQKPAQTQGDNKAQPSATRQAQNRRERSSQRSRGTGQLSVTPAGRQNGAPVIAPAPQNNPGAVPQSQPPQAPPNGAPGQPQTPPAQPDQTTPPAEPTQTQTEGQQAQPQTGGGGAFGSGGFGGGGQRMFGRGGTITMDFRGSDIGNVLKFFSMAAGWQVVPDAGLTGPVTIISPRPLTIDQAFQVLQSTLEVRGFSGQIERRGDVTILKIVPLDRAVQSTSLLARKSTDANGSGTSQSTLNPDELKNQVLTQVIPIENVDATALSRELRDLVNRGASIVASAGTNALIVTDTARNVKRISELVEMLDKAASNSDIRIFPLKNSDATEVTNVINGLFRQVFSRGRTTGGQGGQGGPGGQGGGQPGQPGFPPGFPGGVQIGPDGRPVTGGAAQDRAAVVAVADTRTNSVVAVASADNMKRVAELIDQLDAPESAALKTKTIRLVYADATEIEGIVNSVVSGSTPPRSTGGGGGAGFFQRVFGGGGQFGGAGGQQSTTSTNPFAKVVANARTNSLIVTATDQWMQRIEELVKELDTEVKVETTTFVIPLKNAQATDIASTLGSAFGTQTGMGGGFGGFGSNTFINLGGTQQQRQRVQRRTNTSNQRGGAGFGFGGRAAPLGPVANGQEIAQGEAIRGTLTPNGFYPDEQPIDDASQTRQFFFGQGGFPGGGMQGRQGLGAIPQYGRNQRGNVVNLLQLRQNVGVVPDPASNSLVITATPDAVEAVRQIISELDIIPRQVLIEVIIAEATLDATQKLGVQFDAKGVGKVLGLTVNQSGSSNFPVSGGGTVGQNVTTPLNPGSQYALQAVNGTYNALVQALATDNKIRVLSTPKVFTSNNQQATIDIVTSIPYVSGTFFGGIGGGATANTAFIDVGVTLDVTPRITADGRVTIDVYAEASELLGFDTLQSSVDASGRVTATLSPRTNRRTTDTSVSVRDGEIVVLGGLMRDSKTINANKVPILGDIPLLGTLFRSTTTNTQKTELMIFLVPHVVDTDEQSQKVVDSQSQNVRKTFPDLGKQRPEFQKITPPTPDKQRQQTEPGGGPGEPQKP